MTKLKLKMMSRVRRRQKRASSASSVGEMLPRRTVTRNQDPSRPHLLLKHPPLQDILLQMLLQIPRPRLTRRVPQQLNLTLNLTPLLTVTATKERSQEATRKNQGSGSLNLATSRGIRSNHCLRLHQGTNPVHDQPRNLSLNPARTPEHQSPVPTLLY